MKNAAVLVVATTEEENMNVPIRRSVALALVAAGAMTVTQPVIADNGAFPYRPIRVVQGFSSGGVSDVLSRVIGDRLGPRLGQTIVVEARPGGGGIVGMTYVANQEPDGYTLLLGNSAITVSPIRAEKPPFDTLTMFVPVSMIGTAPSILLAHPAEPVNSVKDLIAYAKTHSGEINCATSGIGTTNDLGVHLINFMAGVKIVPVPFKGSGPSLTAALGHETQLSFAPLLPSIRLVKSGQLKAIGVSSLERNPALPDVPAIAEGLPGFLDVGFYGIVARHDVPRTIVELLHREINATLAESEVRDRLTQLGTDIKIMTRREFAEFIRQDAKKWANLVRSAKLTF
jgi:tripartite-type tricarboxylate transporter receptor subunit TctC